MSAGSLGLARVPLPVAVWNAAFGILCTVVYKLNVDGCVVMSFSCVFHGLPVVPVDIGSLGFSCFGFRSFAILVFLIPPFWNTLECMLLYCLLQGASNGLVR